MQNTPLYIDRTKYKNILFGSDFHFNHVPKSWSLSEKRGFPEINKHDQWILEQLEKTTRNDLIIFLGDYALNSSEDFVLNTIKRTPATMLMFEGNHESYTSRIYKNALNEFYKNTLKTKEPPNANIFPFSIFINEVDKNGKIKYSGFPGFSKNANVVFMGLEATVSIDKQRINLHHMAPLIWDKMKHGVWSICGHSHGSLQLGKPDDLKAKQLDVGVENAISYNGTCFFTIEEVKNIMDKKGVLIHDHHGDAHI